MKKEVEIKEVSGGTEQASCPIRTTAKLSVIYPKFILVLPSREYQPGQFLKGIYPLCSMKL